MLKPEQRLRLFREVQKAVREKKMFVADFWNSGSFSSGCISAGRPGGYLYIDWNGNIAPCVFNPYSPLNINDIYRENKSLNDVLQNPFIREVRRWQRDYALDTPSEKTDNLMLPCPIRDHYEYMLAQLKKHKPKPIDLSAEEALNDSRYQEGLIAYGKRLAGLMDPIWEREVIKPEKTRKKR